MRKLLFVPAAIIDLVSIWTERLTIKEKSSLTYTIAILKWKKWLSAAGKEISFSLFGYTIHACNNADLQHLVKEIFISEVYQLKTKRSELSILDLGANIGLATIYFRMKYGAAYIQALEPNESSFRFLELNIERNNLKNVRALRLAVGAESGKLYMEAGFDPCSLNQRFKRENGTGEAVDAIGIADLLAGRTWDIVKLDIEGGEVEVLEKAIRNKIITKVPVWMIEFHCGEEKIKTISNEFIKEGFELKRLREVFHFTRAVIRY